MWFLPGYFGLLRLRSVPLRRRLSMLIRFLQVDWNVLHGHRPYEITQVVRALAQRRALPGEGLVEAGCWNGGSSAKFSIACMELGYRLWVYDSFEGVEEMTLEERTGSYDFSGEYAAALDQVQSNVRRFGEVACCSFFKGWFKNTIAVAPPPGMVRAVYIDCDLATGTEEVLRGVLPRLATDGAVFTQDFHLTPVRRLLDGEAIWRRLKVEPPAVTYLGDNLALLTFLKVSLAGGAGAVPLPGPTETP
jgi:O-methyltransferase